LMRVETDDCSDGALISDSSHLYFPQQLSLFVDVIAVAVIVVAVRMM
uniref:Disulfide bond formation protein B n=1 Tax=Brugia timori TaxID=42155 RepID=A0A0R3QBD7_9BILA